MGAKTYITAVEASGCLADATVKSALGNIQGCDAKIPSAESGSGSDSGSSGDDCRRRRASHGNATNHTNDTNKTDASGDDCLTSSAAVAAASVAAFVAAFALL